MREILQLIGAMVASVIAVMGYILAILNYRSSNKDEYAGNRLFADIITSSGIAFVCCLIFVVISFIFK